MNRFFGTFSVSFLAAAFFAFLPFFACAADFSASPLIIDLKANPRDILKSTIGVMNSATHVGNIYAFVNNTDPVLGMEVWKSPANVDMADSLANWIEINRSSLEMQPGAKIELPLLIQVNLHAKPGMYHATITFSEGNTRAEAEAAIKYGVSVAINLEVKDDAKEILELSGFTSKGTFISEKEASFTYNIKNIGNRSLAPKGEVRIFNRSGEEVATLDVNKNGEVVDPNKTAELASVWKSGSRFGRYKAMVNIEYGSKGMGALQDTVFFWLVPWKEILVIFFCLLIVLLSFTTYWQNNYSLRSRQQTAHASAHDFVPNAPTVQHQVYSPARRAAFYSDYSEPELPRRDTVRETTRPFPQAKNVATGAVKIEPIKQNNFAGGDPERFVVSLKK